MQGGGGGGGGGGGEFAEGKNPNYDSARFNKGLNSQRYA